MSTPQSQILSYLSQGGRLTTRKAAQLFYTTELRSVVSRLRKRGHVILSERKSAETIDGRDTWYNEYYMPEAKPTLWFKIKEFLKYSV